MLCGQELAAVLVGHHHKPENYGEGSFRVLQCGKLQRLPKVVDLLRTSGISMQAGVSGRGTGPGRRSVFGNKQVVWENRAVEILESQI